MLFEAVELRDEYDLHIKLLEQLTDSPEAKRERYYSRDEDENREPVSEFNRKELEIKLKKLKTKRVKLNQEIQMTNFKVQVDYNGEKSMARSWKPKPVTIYGLSIYFLHIYSLQFT